MIRLTLCQPRMTPRVSRKTHTRSHSNTNACMFIYIFARRHYEVEPCWASCGLTMRMPPVCHLSSNQRRHSSRAQEERQQHAHLCEKKLILLCIWSTHKHLCFYISYINIDVMAPSPRKSDNNMCTCVYVDTRRWACPVRIRGGWVGLCHVMSQ